MLEVVSLFSKAQVAPSTLLKCRALPTLGVQTLCKNEMITIASWDRKSQYFLNIHVSNN